MSFVKRTYVDQQTVITADNLNDIQDELLRLGVSEESLWNSVTSAGTKASNALDNEAAAYNYHLQYHVGDYCLYQQKLYRCTVETPAAGETWNSSHWTAVTVGDEMIETASELSELRNTLNHKADVIYDTASGDIASFPDGADGLPVKDLTVGIEPVQDLHGQANPYPPGGGKNLFQTTLTSQTIRGVTFTVNSDGSIKAENSATSNISTQATFGCVTLPAGTYKANGFSNGGESAQRMVIYSETSGSRITTICQGHEDVSFSLEAESVVKIYPIIESGLSTGFTFYPMIRLSTDSDPTFAPYSNICPISGWTGCNVTRAGKNLCKLNNDGRTNNGITFTVDDSTVTMNGEATNAAWLSSSSGLANVVPFVLNASGTYTVTVNSASSVTNRMVRKDGTSVDITSGTPYTFTVQDYDEIKFNFGVANGTMLTNLKATVMVEIGNSSSAYEPYVGQVYPITFPSGTTVYGGMLELPSCVLTVDRGIVDVGNLTIASFIQEKHIGAYSITDRAYGSDVNLPSICSTYKFFGYSSSTGLINYLENGQYGFQRTSGAVRIRDDRFNNENDFVAAMSGVKIVYYLATPLVIQLDPVTVTTLLGQNNIWADCGPSTIEYPCDTKLYIQKINAPTDDDMIADANIASGQYFIVNNNLYISTAAILAGDPIKPGTNCTLTNLAAALNALNS